ncbi:hypothetical protein ACN28S_24295 [Cystobacter fuscus]
MRSILRAVDDVNRLDPQPDFVLFGGDRRSWARRRSSTWAGRSSRRSRRPCA